MRATFFLGLIAAAGCNGTDVAIDLPLYVATSAVITSRAHAVTTGFQDHGSDLGCVRLEIEARDEDLARVARRSGCEVTIETRAPGDAAFDLEVEIDDGEIVSGERELWIRDPVAQELRATCDPAREVAYRAGAPILLRQAMYAAGSDHLLFGDVFLVDAVTADGAEVPVARVKPWRVELEAQSAGAVLTLTPRHGDEPLVVHAIADGEVDALRFVQACEASWYYRDCGAALDSAPVDVPSALAIGERRLVSIAPRVRGIPVCGADLPLEIAERTPRFCTIIEPDATHDSFDASPSERPIDLRSFILEGRQQGDCAIEVATPDGRLSSTLRIRVEN